MGNDWKGALAKCFEDNRILETSIVEVREQFEHFCEYVAQPALEQLKQELDEYKVSAKIHTARGASIEMLANFVKSSICQFQYTLYLPKNSLRLEIKAKVGARKNKKGIVETEEYPFFEGLSPEALLALNQEDFLLDVVRHYRNVLFSSTVNSE